MMNFFKSDGTMISQWLGESDCAMMVQEHLAFCVNVQTVKQIVFSPLLGC